MVSFVAVGLLALLFSAVNAGSLVLSNTLGSNMVLQRAPAAANIWGWATPSETVSIDVQGPTSQTQQATAASDGSWLVSLTPTNAGGPYTITVASSDGEKLQLTNVLFGDVWICGGQSNMEFTVACGFNATAEIQAANNYPNIRIFTVGDYHYSSTPLAQLNQTLQPWSVASNTTVGLGEWNAFSAVCWFTGRDLYDQYQVPLGLISSNWGGTVVQAWSSPTALKACNITTSGTGNEANSVLYNAMIVPFLNQVIKGALWYQGEQNAGQAAIYNCAFPAMIADWRANWAPASGKEFPFLFVQLAATIAGSGSGWADTRQAQFDASLVLDNVGFATAVDLGDPTSPFGNVHPRDKQDVGKRLALAARNIAYGETDVVWQGPTFVSWTSSISGNTAEAVVTFKTWGASGLVAREAYCPTNESVPLNNCGGWNILLSNNQWYNATQTVSGNTVTATVTDIPSGTTVTGVSYAYASWPQCTIYSQEGLPAIPFRYPPNIVPPTNF